MNDWMTDQQNEGTDELLRSAWEMPNRWNTSSKIPTYATHDPGFNPDHLPAGSSRPNGMPANWNQEGKANQPVGGGSANQNFLVACLVLGVIVALLIIAAGVL